MDYIKRSITHKIVERLKKRRVIAVTGARQTGKTVLCKNIIPSVTNKPYKYYTFDDPEERIRFKNNAIAILESTKEPLIILDEIQKIPDLFDPLKYLADKENKDDKRFIITGSSQILLAKGIKETLAGRISIFNLFPLSFGEILSKAGKPIFLDKIIEHKDIKKDDMNEISFFSSDELRYIENKRDKSVKWGGYPSLWQTVSGNEFLDSDAERAAWLKDYRNTYIERDISDIGEVHNLDSFIIAQKLLALRTGQVLSFSEIAKETGVAVNTVKRYIFILNATFQCFLLSPYFGNISKRLIKSPKIFFSDTGISMTIAGEDGLSQGAAYETWVFSELLKWKEAKDAETELFFFRSASGVEVDFIIKIEGVIIPIEVKSSRRVGYADAKGIESFMNYYRDRNKIYFGIIAYPGREIKEVRKNIFAVPDWFLLS